ncbi:MAG: Asp-tRNA(Asn)/Glu-tRNA(Gln) amidotransferase subunit GatA [Pseudomonadota bacterium]
MDILRSSIPVISKALKEKKISCRELTDFYLKRIKSNAKLNAYITVEGDSALSAADKIDKKGFTAADSLLKGIPVALKDNFMVEGVKTTCASKILDGYVAPYDGTAVKKLKINDAVIVGKTNMDEFAMGSSNENSCFGPVLNPWDNSKVAGGSSGGSAVSVSAGLSQIAYGTDTGGSVKLPASYNGILALRPTFGRISRYGIVAFGSSLDQIGPMARNVEDLAIAYDAVSGFDEDDVTTSPRRSASVYDYLLKNVAGKEGSFSKYTIGIPAVAHAGTSSTGVDPEVTRSMDGVIEVLKKLGFKFKDISLPHSKYALDVYYIISPGEVSSNLSRFDGVRYGFRAKDYKDLDSLYGLTRGNGFGDEVKRRIMLGTFVLSAGYYDAYFAKAAKVRTLVRQDFERAFTECDIIMYPTAPTTAFKLGEQTKDPLTMYLNDLFTIPSSLAAVPSLSFPSGLSSKGLPIGMQLIAKHFDEEKLFTLAWILQKENPDWFNNIADGAK